MLSEIRKMFGVEKRRGYMWYHDAELQDKIKLDLYHRLEPVKGK